MIEFFLNDENKSQKNMKITPIKFSCSNKHVSIQETQDNREHSSVKALELLGNKYLITW